MRTVQMTMDEELLAAVDRAARRMKTTRSAFTRLALRDALLKHRTVRLEQKRREGYLRKPVAGGEFDVWEDEQTWGDA